MTHITMYHNPNCRHSCAAHAWLCDACRQDTALHMDIVLYLEKPPSKDDVMGFFRRIHAPLEQFIRPTHPLYDTLGLKGKQLDEDDMASVLSRHPPLMQRPLVFIGEEGIIARDIDALRLFVEEHRDD